MSAVCSCCNAEKFHINPFNSVHLPSLAVGVSNAAVETHKHSIIYMITPS